MGLFNKLFGSKAKTEEPDNTKLLALIDLYWKANGTGDTYKNVIEELMNGNSFLMFPTQNEANTDKWSTLKKSTTLKLASVANLDGLKVLGVFTDEQALVSWAKKPSQYTAMRSQDVLKFAEENGMDRIVINSDQPNMFVLERNRSNITQHTIQRDTQVQLGAPSRPLSKPVTQKLIANFKKNNTISEVYQYGQTKEGEFSIVLGIKLTTNSENARNAAMSAVQNALEGETLTSHLTCFLLKQMVGMRPSGKLKTLCYTGNERV